MPADGFSPCLTLRGMGMQQACTGREACLCCCVQKWSKGKMKEKVNNQVLFDKVSTISCGQRPKQPTHTAQPWCQGPCLQTINAVPL
jgi:hypothetical protein